MKNEVKKAAEKSKGFFAEFKTFIAKGNALNLAVGVIIGGAFQSIVNSIVNDLISPLLSLITKGINFTDKFIILAKTEETFKTAEAAKEAGFATFNYGALITAVINFFIMAFVIFLIVKGINKVTSMGKKEEEEASAAPTTKKCPFCKTEIDIEAVKCPNCTSDIPAEEAAEE